MKVKNNLLSILILALVVVSCSSTPKLPFKGKIIGVEVKTTLDSKLAISLAENINKKDTIDENLSTDSKTILLLEKYYQKNKEINQKYRRLTKETFNKNNLYFSEDILYLFVPGFMYKSDTTTGADFKRQFKLFSELKINHKLINIYEKGLVESNARIIANEIKIQSRNYKNIVLVSASKGGLESAIAIGKYLDINSSKNLVAWVSIGGTLRGTYLADHAKSFPKSLFARIVTWIIGFNYKLVNDLSVKKNERIFKKLDFPKHIKYIQYIGVPFSGQVGEDVKSRYEELRSYGPNDGITTIEHQIIEDGHVIFEIGLDHFFRDEDIDKKTLALILLTLDLIKKK